MLSNLQNVLNRHLRAKSRLETWAGLIGHKALSEEQQRQRKHFAAEDRNMRRQLFGETEQPESDEMGHTILGDVIGTPQQASNLGTIAALLLGASLPVAGIAGAAAMYLWRDKADVPATETTDETVSIGLGKIEDYLGQPE